MKLTINKKPYHISPISELTFDQYNTVVIQGKAVDLPEYLAVMTGLDPEDLMKAEISTASIPALYQQLINIEDHEAVIKEKKEAIDFDGEIRLMDELNFTTFGQSYIFEMINQNKKLNDFQKAVYALAISLSDSYKIEDVNEAYKKLNAMNWMSVLPQAFFLHKKFTSGRMDYMRLWLSYTFKLKSLRKKILISKKSYRKAEKI